MIKKRTEWVTASARGYGWGKKKIIYFSFSFSVLADVFEKNERKNETVSTILAVS